MIKVFHIDRKMRAVTGIHEFVNEKEAEATIEEYEKMYQEHGWEYYVEYYVAL